MPNQFTKTPDFGIPNSRGIDRAWRSASDYPIDTVPELEPLNKHFTKEVADEFEILDVDAFLKSEAVI